MAIVNIAKWLISAMGVQSVTHLIFCVKIVECML